MKFDTAARSERYFTMTMFTHLLMAENFKGLKKFYEYLSFEPSNSSNADTFEVVSELDSIRDGRLQRNELIDTYLNNGRVAVPDLFLRWNNKIFVIEAKFFTLPSRDELKRQCELQKKSIDYSLNYTNYKECDIKYIALTVSKNFTNKLNQDYLEFISWHDVISFMKQCYSETKSYDIKYCFYVIDDALKRAQNELNNSKHEKLEQVQNIKTLLQNLSSYVDRNMLYVGFVGGERKLKNASLDDLENRGHYKIRKDCINDNWIQLGKLLEHYIYLKNIQQKK